MNIFKIVFSALIMVLLSFSIQAQSCQGSKSGKAACCAKSEAKACCASTATAEDGTASATLVSDNASTETFKVYGNCGMCKSRIEGALKDVEGVHTASWDASTKMMTVSFDAKVISVADVQKKIAAVGHDTEQVKAEDAVYNQLHGCCQYDRERS